MRYSHGELVQLAEEGRRKQMWSKYHAKKVVTPAGVFDSKREYERFVELAFMEKADKIQNLRRQVEYELIPEAREPDTVGPKGGRKKGKIIERAVRYRADFVYVENGEEIVEDVKGLRTKEYLLKRKLMLYRYGIRIREVE